MNYLELCNEVLIRMREDEITAIDDPNNEPQQKLVTRFVKDAYDFVLKAHTWNGNRKVWTIPVVEGQDTYPLPISTEAASLYTVELKQGCDKIGNLIEVGHPWMALRDECKEGTPMYFSPAQVVDGKLGVQIWPMPVKEGDSGGGSGPGPEPEPVPPECGGHSCTDYGEMYPPELQTIGVAMADATGNVWETTTDADGNTRLTTLDGGISNVWGTGTRLDLASFANRNSDNVFCQNYAYVGGADSSGTTVVLESGANALAQGWVTGDIEGTDWEQSTSFLGEIPSQKVTVVWEAAVYLDFNDPAYGSDSYIEIEPQWNIQWKTSNSVFANPYSTPPKYAINGTTGTITATYGQATYYPAQSIAAGVGPDKMTGWYYFKVESSMYLDNDTGNQYGEAKDFDTTFTFVSPIGTIVRDTVGTPPPSVGLGKIGNLYSGSPNLYLKANQQYGTQQTRIIGIKNGTIDDEAKVFARMQRNYVEPDYCPIIVPPEIPQSSVGDTTERAGPALVDLSPGDYPVEGDFTFEIDFFMPSDTVYRNLFALGGNPTNKYGAVYGYSTNSDRFVINSSRSGTTTDGEEIVDSASENVVGKLTGVRRTIVIQREGDDTSVWIDGVRDEREGSSKATFPGDGPTKIPYPSGAFEAARLSLFKFSDGTVVQSPASNVVVYGHRFTPLGNVYDMLASTITPEFGPVIPPAEEPEADEGGDDGSPVLTGDDLVIHGYGMAPTLELAEDVCEIPSQPVLYYALAFASRERGEVGGQSANELFSLAKTYLADAIAWNVNNAPLEYLWEQT